MVREGYRQVYRHHSYTFEQASLDEGAVLQPVRIIEVSGAPSIAIYVMERQPDTSWRVGGVILIQDLGLKV